MPVAAPNEIRETDLTLRRAYCHAMTTKPVPTLVVGRIRFIFAGIHCSVLNLPNRRTISYTILAILHSSHGSGDPWLYATPACRFWVKVMELIV